MRNPISVIFETASVSFIGFTRDLGLMWLKKIGKGLVILRSLWVPLFFMTLQMWRAIPPYLVVWLAPNGSSDICSQKPRPLVAADMQHPPSFCFFQDLRSSWNTVLNHIHDFPHKTPQSQTRSCCCLLPFTHSSASSAFHSCPLRQL